MGDLNFRLKEGTFNFEEIDQHVRKEEYSVLFAEDQLRETQRNKLAFSELTERDPNFAPTFKFKVGFDEYNAK